MRKTRREEEVRVEGESQRTGIEDGYPLIEVGSVYIGPFLLADMPVCVSISSLPLDLRTSFVCL